MKRIVLAILVMITMLTANVSFAFVEPKNFRDHKWGEYFSDFSNMVLFKENTGGGGNNFYTMNSDDLKIGDIDLDNIIYEFWNYKFVSVIIVTKGERNYRRLLETCRVKYDEPYQPNEYIDSYLWAGSNVNISMEYNKFNGFGTLVIASKSIQKEQEEYSAAKAAENAKKGF